MDCDLDNPGTIEITRPQPQLDALRVSAALVHQMFHIL